MELLQWLWVGLAVIFLVGEIFTVGFFLACFSVGAAAAALLAFLDVGFAWQLGAFVVISGAAVVLSRPFAEKITGEQPVGVAADRVLGKRAVVLETLEASAGSGKVRVDREEWRAETADGTKVPAGSWVEVVAVDGAHLVVRPLAPGEDQGGAS